jgi:hypothetical protein
MLHVKLRFKVKGDRKNVDDRSSGPARRDSAISDSVLRKAGIVSTDGAGGGRTVTGLIMRRL